MKKTRNMLIALTSIAFLITACAPTQKKQLIPDGQEYFTLLSCLIEPEVITPNGSDLIISYKTNTPIETENVRPVIVIVSQSATHTQRQYPFTLSPDEFRYNLSNPTIHNPTALNYGRGQLSGSGTIYVYLERGAQGSPDDSRERVSNVLSVYATFDPKKE